MAAKSLLLLSLSLTILFISSPTSVATDPDPLQDFCVADLSSAVVVNGFPCKQNTIVVSDDFSSAALSEAANTYDIFGSNVSVANVLTFQGLNTLGLSMSRGEVLVGFVSSAGVFYSKVIVAGMNFIIPRGLMHFELNVGKGKALETTAFNS
ncbi:Germin-like protein 3-8 [Ananas comosus]|uniref:Germin-like protein 3-8 n=1 Tax=Ananas comosus TaxID=4615 RepID=A0A199V0W5_ANACO|nr:Germin-like protein 3-8 [Ananas comosus]